MRYYRNCKPDDRAYQWKVGPTRTSRWHLTFNHGVEGSSPSALTKETGRFCNFSFPARTNWEAHGKQVRQPALAKEAPAMIDASFSRQRDQENRAIVRDRRRLIIPLVAALLLIGGGWMTAWAFGGSKAAAPPSEVSTASATSGRPSDELLETAKGLQVTQQQAVDQLQVVQDKLAAQQAETKKLSEQIAAVTEKLDALQRSVADIPAPPVAAPVSPPKSRHQ
jgi:uncharacterized coiled-coil protein SlyX